jgi:hypothetical protein
MYVYFLLLIGLSYNVCISAYLFFHDTQTQWHKNMIELTCHIVSCKIRKLQGIG